MKSSRIVLATLAAAVLVGVGGAAPAVASGADRAAPAAAPAAAAKADLYQRTELYFGTQIPGTGRELTPAEFDNFVDKEITPAFPNGLTQLTARGQWKDSTGTIEKERTYVIVLFWPVSDRNASGEIEEIRTDYKKFFQQESVLRADTVQRVSF